ncbi:MAG: hypothetical protein JSV99_10360 [Planctomycetota bacterium]|nr:MAG: hypothetical protein JSV99_10360 [Planctomycetota bacterium]
MADKRKTIKWGTHTQKQPGGERCSPQRKKSWICSVRVTGGLTRRVCGRFADRVLKNLVSDTKLAREVDKGVAGQGSGFEEICGTGGILRDVGFGRLLGG